MHLSVLPRPQTFQEIMVISRKLKDIKTDTPQSKGDKAFEDWETNNERRPGAAKRTRVESQPSQTDGEIYRLPASK